MWVFGIMVALVLLWVMKCGLYLDVVDCDSVVDGSW